MYESKSDSQLLPKLRSIPTKPTHNLITFSRADILSADMIVYVNENEINSIDAISKLHDSLTTLVPNAAWDGDTGHMVFSSKKLLHIFRAIPDQLLDSTKSLHYSATCRSIGELNYYSPANHNDHTVCTLKSFSLFQSNDKRLNTSNVDFTMEGLILNYLLNDIPKTGIHSKFPTICSFSSSSSTAILDIEQGVKNSLFHKSSCFLNYTQVQQLCSSIKLLFIGNLVLPTEVDRDGFTKYFISIIDFKSFSDFSRIVLSLIKSDFTSSELTIRSNTNYIHLTFSERNKSDLTYFLIKGSKTSVHQNCESSTSEDLANLYRHALAVKDDLPFEFRQDMHVMLGTVIEPDLLALGDLNENNINFPI